MKKAKLDQKVSLCHRCEHRAKSLENGSGPRYECSSSGSVSSCYMYCPVKPVIVKPNDCDRRPVGAIWLLSPRQHIEGLMEGKLELVINKDGSNYSYWAPKKDDIVYKLEVPGSR